MVGLGGGTVVLSSLSKQRGNLLTPGSAMNLIPDRSMAGVFRSSSFHQLAKIHASTSKVSIDRLYSNAKKKTHIKNNSHSDLSGSTSLRKGFLMSPSIQSIWPFIFSPTGFNSGCALKQACSAVHHNSRSLVLLDAPVSNLHLLFPFPFY